jgi:regulatory protein
MIITAVERQETHPHRYNIYLDGEYAFSVHEDILVKHRLLKGGVLESRSIESVLRDEERQKAYHASLRYMSGRPRSEKEVRDRLTAKGFEEETIVSVLHQLNHEGYLDDREFARMWAEQRVHSRKKGRLSVVRELRRKGIGKDRIQEALSQLDEQIEADHAYRLLSSRWLKLSGEYRTKKQKLLAYLFRKGYTRSVIQQAIRQWNEAHPEDPL